MSKTSNEITMIGYYTGDEFGSNGWWIEGNDPARMEASAVAQSNECGFGGEIPEFTFVELDQIAKLDDDKFDELLHQYNLATCAGWVSDEASSVIDDEADRRDV